MSLVIPGLSGKVTKAALISDLTVLRGSAVRLTEFLDDSRDPGVTDDTAAWQAMVAEAVAAGADHLLVEGVSRFDPGEVDWDSLGEHTLFVHGELRLLSTLVRKSSQHFIGLGGTTGTQFQIGPACLVTQIGTWTEPCVQFKGDNNHYGRGIFVNQPYGPGIQVGYTEDEANQSSLCRLENVGVLTRAGVETSEGLRAENTFWLWVRDFAFNSQIGSGPSIHFADSYYPGPSANGTALIDIRDGVISGEGIWFNRGFDSAQPAYHFRFTNIHQENGRSAFIVFKSIYADYHDIVIDNVNMADILDAEAAWIDNTIGGLITGLTIRQPNLWYSERRIIMGRPPIGNVTIEANRTFRYSESYRDYDGLPFKFRFQDDGEVEQVDGFRGFDLRESIVPSNGVLYPSSQDISTWDITGGISVTPGATWLDGSTGAFAVEFPSGGSTIAKTNSAAALTDHYLIVGAWLRAEEVDGFATDQNGTLLLITHSGSTGGHWDDDAAITGAWYVVGRSALSAQQKAGWVFLSEARKWTASSGPTALGLNLRSEKAQTILVYRPFILALPASVYTPREVTGFLSNICNVDVTA